jgi:hypothetical protein
MARQLIKAAHSNDDTSIPGADTLARYVYRWESGAVGLTDRYKLYYCQAFGIPPADFGAQRGEHAVYRFSVSGDLAKEVIGVLEALRDVFRAGRETRAALEAYESARKPPARAAVDTARAGPKPETRPAIREEM